MATKALLAAVLLPSIPGSCLGQSDAWRCADERLRVSLWSADVVQGTQMRFAPDGSLWMIELRGRLLRLSETAEGICANTVFEFAERARSADPQTGATSIAFSPDFDGTRGTLYVAHNWDEPGGDLLLMTFDVDASSRGSSRIYRIRANRSDDKPRVARAAGVGP